MTGEAMSVSVDMELGEAVRVAPIAFQAIVGSQRWSLIPAAIGMAIGVVLAPTLGVIIFLLVFKVAGQQAAMAVHGRQESFSVALELAGALTGWKVGEARYWRRNTARFIAGLKERGSPAIFTTTFTIGPDGLRTGSERGGIFASWPSIVQVWSIPSHWLVQTDSLTLALPKRAFPTAQDERQFISALSVSMTEEARQRSASALGNEPPAPETAMRLGS